MIVLVKTKEDKIEKCYVRDAMFIKLEENNMPSQNSDNIIHTNKIESVIWVDEKGSRKEYSPSEWINLAIDADFWGTNN